VWRHGVLAKHDFFAVAHDTARGVARVNN
jgi:hypothetical protein